MLAGVISIMACLLRVMCVDVVDDSLAFLSCLPYRAVLRNVIEHIDIPLRYFMPFLVISPIISPGYSMNIYAS